MASNPRTPVDSYIQSDATTAIAVSRTLFSGLVISVAVMVLGLVLVLSEGKNVTTHVVSLDRVIPDLVHGSRSAVLDCGILVLFATPLVGVLVAFVQFVRRRDAGFSLITALLLVILTAGFVVALH